MTVASREPVNLSGQKMGSKGQRTRRRIIDTTVAQLERTGLRDLRVTDIAQIAEMSPATFYLYFEDVMEVVLAAAAETSQSLPELLELLEHDWTQPGDEGAAMRFVERYIVFWDDHRPLLRARNIAAEEGDARFTAVREAAVRPLLEALTAKVAKAQENGLVPTTTRPFAFAGSVLMMLERLGALSHTHVDRPPETTLRHLLIACAEMLNWVTGVDRSALID